MPRSYLFLQGPHGPFFRELGDRLLAEGHKVLRVNFNGGDWIDWPDRNSIEYRGDEHDWPGFCDQLFEDHRVTDIVLYGDCRSLHQRAIEIANATGVRVHAFEEGYFRPDWITLEENGVNGHSTLPLEPSWILDNSRLDDEAESQSVGPSMRWLLFYCLRYYLFKTLRSRRFRSYVLHRPYRSSQELFLWLRYLVRMPVLRWRSSRAVRELRDAGKPYYLVGLQLDSDSQLRVHSPYLSVAGFLSEVLDSFAKNAPQDSLLVIKKHPLDHGAVSHETLSMIEAYSLGVRERIRFIHSGSLPELIKRSRGVVVVNSTVGTSALHHGKPTLAMGEAVYRIAGLTWQGGLDRFWTDAPRPDDTLYRAFRCFLLRDVLVNGGFFSRRGRSMALPVAAERLCSPPEKKVCPLKLVKGVESLTPQKDAV